MRTAEEILKTVDDSRMVYHTNAVAAIKIAMKEAIEECAERAKSEWIRYSTNIGHAIVDKQSILSLINELK